MLKPITEEEKAKYTLKVQTERAIQELLAEAYESGYNGYIDIWPIINSEKKQIIFEIQSKKILTPSAEASNKFAVRYHVLQGKGCKKIKQFS